MRSLLYVTTVAALLGCTGKPAPPKLIANVTEMMLERNPAPDAKDDEEVVGKFVLENAGGQELTFAVEHASCNCSKQWPKKGVVPPQGSETFYLAAKRSRLRQVLSVGIGTNDPERRSFGVRLIVEPNAKPPYVVAGSDVVYLGEIVEGDVERTIQVAAFEPVGAAPWIVAGAGDDGGVQIVSAPQRSSNQPASDQDEAHQVWYTAQLKLPAKLAPGDARFRIRWFDAQKAVVGESRLHGRVVDAVEIVPSNLYVPKSAGPSTHRIFVRDRHPDRSAKVMPPANLPSGWTCTLRTATPGVTSFDLVVPSEEFAAVELAFKAANDVRTLRVVRLP